MATATARRRSLQRMVRRIVSTVCINNLECGVIGNVGKPLPELSLPLGQCLALSE